MNFKELISKRRACKLFNDKKISEEDLHFILESGILAPSSHGFEPWKFIILDKKEDNQKLAKLCFDQASVASASHNIILLARKDLQSKDDCTKTDSSFCRLQGRKFSKNFKDLYSRY